MPVEVADLDLVTGRLNPMVLGERTRQVSLRLDRMSSGTDNDDDNGSSPSGSGEFNPCGVCDTRAGFGRSSVQDHQTKGDQPFQALVTRQIEVQPPGPQPYSEFAPLRGRKVLVFSDSRQTAARLAPNLQTYSMQDVIRPLILRGWRTLQAQPLLADALTLDHLFLAALVASDELSVRLRPELKATESLRVMNDVAEAMRDGALDGHPPAVMDLIAAAADSTTAGVAPRHRLDDHRPLLRPSVASPRVDSREADVRACDHRAARYCGRGGQPRREACARETVALSMGRTNCRHLVQRHGHLLDRYEPRSSSSLWEVRLVRSVARRQGGEEGLRA